jgi:hypothetical protein
MLSFYVTMATGLSLFFISTLPGSIPAASTILRFEILVEAEYASRSPLAKVDNTLFQVFPSYVTRYRMMITVKSRIENGSIRLPKRVKLPDGTQVIVRIEPIHKPKEKLKIISELSGAWSNDPTIISIFADIDQERHRYFGREVSFE